ncbi:hypothetical protein Acsp03_40690 [Actinomadura sp. NBRC 104412]|nr:hypothetical protein Acsp03_40690 [Actinomadura sp. NBRC 104412]
MLYTFHWCRGEGFGLIVEDLLRAPGGNRVIAEGVRLLPRLVKALTVEPGYAVWPLSAPEFRRAVAAAGRSRAGQAIPNWPGTTCWSATGCSPIVCVRRSGAPEMDEDELVGRVARAFGF